jgi:hypothetical protein
MNCILLKKPLSSTAKNQIEQNKIEENRYVINMSSMRKNSRKWKSGQSRKKQNKASLDAKSTNRANPSGRRKS